MLLRDTDHVMFCSSFTIRLYINF